MCQIGHVVLLQCRKASLSILFPFQAPCSSRLVKKAQPPGRPVFLSTGDIKAVFQPYKDECF